MSNSRAPAAKTAGAVSTPGTADSQDPANSQKRDTQSDLAFRSVSSYTLEVEGRIKILNESGLERRKISEVMPAEASLEEFAAASFGQAGEVAQVDRKAVEVSDGSIRFEIPGAAIGSVLEYHYKFQCRDLSTFRGWTFQTDLPVQKSTFRIKMMQATSLPYRFVKTAENQVIDPSQENVLGIDRTPWVVLTWTQSDLLGVDHGPRAALLIGD